MAQKSHFYCAALAYLMLEKTKAKEDKNHFALEKTTHHHAGKVWNESHQKISTCFQKHQNRCISSVSYIPLAGGGFLYLTAWMDLFSRRIVGWHLEVHMQEALILEAFQRAVKTRRCARL